MSISLPFATNDQKYPFSYLRKLMQAVGPGLGPVNVGTDFFVSPGSGLQVQIAAGAAFVAQTVTNDNTSVWEGNYFVFNDGTISPSNTISAPISNPRVDIIELTVTDVNEQALSGSSSSKVQWKTGTETSGANLTNLNGAPTADANSLILAYVLQTTGESSIPSSNIQNVVSVGAGRSPFTPIAATSSMTAVSGQFVSASPGVTITLPAPSAGAFVGVMAISTVTGASPVTVHYGSGSGHITGVGAASVASYLLGTAEAATILQSDGTNWNIITGQQDSGWVALSLGTSIVGAGYTPSARLQGDVVRLKGGLENSSGSTILTAVTLATVPAGLRPTVTPLNFASVIGTSPVPVGLTSGGLITTSGLAASAILSLDNISYSIS